MFLDVADLLEFASTLEGSDLGLSLNHAKHVSVLRQMQLKINRDNSEWYALDYALSVLQGTRAVPYLGIPASEEYEQYKSKVEEP